MATTYEPLKYTPARAYTGGCHCGAVRYSIRLGFPDFTFDPKNPPPGFVPTDDIPLMSLRRDVNRMYRCNCSICHKSGHLHLRLVDPHNDFILHSPLSLAELGDYQCNDKIAHFYFCKTCGVRPFIYAGKTGFATGKVDLEAWKEGKWSDEEAEKAQDGAAGAGELTEVLRHGKGDTPSNDYLSINAVTLDGGQEGLDLREWHEKNWMFYGNRLDGFALRFGTPYLGGIY